MNPFHDFIHFTSSTMDARQILDSLTSHISLFHRSSLKNTAIGGHRSSILRWFSSLTLEQRQSHLTAVDHTFVQLLLRMRSNLLSNGHSFFFVLPDLPSSATSDLPSLCFRSSHGLLARRAERNVSEMLIRDSVRLFGSKEEDYHFDKCFSSTICLDSMTVSSDFVSDVDGFVAAMDDVSGGGFLMGDDVGLAEDWVEMPWLKAMGYYSMEAFVANRLEMSLRWAWFNRSSNKKGVRLKEKLREKAAAAAVGSNVFCRKKGFCDWWMKLDHRIRVRVFRMVFGKAAKTLIDDVVKMAYKPAKDKALNFSVKMEQKHKYNSYMTHRRPMHILSDNNEFGSATIPTSVSDAHALFHTTFDRFLVLQDILSILSSYQCNDFEEEKLFFTTLSSVYTISECLLRRSRGLLMLVSLECTKLELLRHFEPQQQKSTQISVSSKHRKKGRSRNTKQGNRSESDMIMSKCHIENNAPAAKVSNNRDVTHHLVKENPPAATVARSSRKGRRKNSSCKSNSCLKESDGDVILKVNPNLYTSGGLGIGKLASSSDNSPFLGSKPNLTDIACLEPNLCSCTQANETISVNYTDNHSGNHFDCSKKNSLHGHANGNMLKNDIEDDDRIIYFESITRSHNHSSEIDMNASLNESRNACYLKTTDYASNPCPNLVPKFECVLRGDTSSQNSKKNGNFMNSVLNCASVKASEKEKTNSKIQGRESDEIIDSADHRRFVDCLLCDCADIDHVPHLHHQYMNFHHPSTITERLHLDVGRNWNDHFHWSMLPPRISSVESGGVCVGSQQMPLSLDWPPMVRSIHRVVQPMTYNNYDYGDFTSNKKSPFWRAGFTGHGIQPAGDAESEGKHSAEFGWPPGRSTTQKLTSESEGFRLSEEEMEMHSVSGRDYSRYFGGGLMYWNSSDQPGIGFSRPPSLSSDDSSWAWHDTDLVRSVDDIVAFSSSYSTTGLTSPTTTHLYSPFDTSSIGNQGHGYVPPMNELAGTTFPSSSKVQDHFTEESAPGYLPSLSDDAEAKTWDSLPHPVLRPIIIPSMSAKKSMSEFSHSRGHKSPCLPPLKDRARMKRPPSPIVLSVSNAQCPTASVASTGDPRRQKGVPIARSGSSSPRNCGLRGCYQDLADFYTPHPCLDGSEVMWPSWRKRNLSTHTMVQPLPGGTLLHDHIITLSQLACDQDHPDVAFPLQPPEMTKCPTRRALVHSMQNRLHDEIELFCKRVASDNNIRKPYVNWAVQRVAKSLQDLWPRSKSNIYGSSATGLSLPTSDVDLVVCLPPVRNLEPIKEAGILEGRNGIKETCLQHAARCLANQDWVKIDSLKTIENTAIPIIVLVVEVPCDMIAPGVRTIKNAKCAPSSEVDSVVAGEEHYLSKNCPEINHSLNQIRIDISFKSHAHTGLQTTEMVKDLIEQFPAAIPLSLVLKQFLADRSLDQSYSGGLSSYCLVLFVIRFLQHRSHHGLFLNQNHGSLLMDFLYFFGNIFDPRRMRISIKGSGLYMKREKGYSIDPLHIDDPLFPTNNVGRNCFRMHQCIKAFSDAFTVLENELSCFSPDNDCETKAPYGLLQKIVPSIYNL